MNHGCEEYRSRMSSLISESAPQGSDDLRSHLEECPACQEYMKMLQADDALLTQFAEAMRPARGRVEEAVFRSFDNPLSKGRDRPVVPTTAVFADRRPWLTAAAAVAMVSLGVLAWFLVSLGMPSPTLAQTLAAMKGRPWVHSLTAMRSKEGIAVYEDWQRFGVHVRARKTPGGLINYLDYPKNTMYQYNPSSNQITVSFVTDTYLTPEAKSAFDMLSEGVELAQRAGGTITRQPLTEQGRPMERIRLTFTGDPYPRWVELIRDVEENLLVRMEQGDGGEDDELRISVTFDYPEVGPADIFALGVPADGAVLDIRPEGPALALVHRIQEKFERGVGDHLAVVLESEIGEDGTLSPRMVSILRQKGGLKRADHYRASDYEGDSRRFEVQADWRDLTIPQALATATDDALEWRMFFDGRRTVRYSRDLGGLVRQEVPMIDEFMILDRGPFVHTITNLIWPNLYLMIQDGPSHLKREIRLLDDDPNRPGLVGLQFVRFAETEDFWFDPDHHDVLKERIRIQQHVVIQREFIKELGQTPAGLWYPRVIEGESTNPEPVDAPKRIRRWERRILFEERPAMDDALFDPATLTR